MGRTFNVAGICLVAILKDEQPFLDEWLLYHRMLGVDHFFLYDDDQDAALEEFLNPHQEYVTVVPWFGRSSSMSGVDRQTKAYWHAFEHYAGTYEWMAVIDGDEFIVLREHQNLKVFLSSFSEASAISLNWHVFGHNGYFEDPQGLITVSLTRRMLVPSRNIKTITRTASIRGIISAHFCLLKNGLWVDPNHRMFREEIYPGKTDVAHVNHYQCRSFSRWMSRVTRGVPGIDEAPIVDKDNLWRVDSELCLRQFVSTVACNKNEFVDEYMLKYKDYLEEKVKNLFRFI